MPFALLALAIMLCAPIEASSKAEDIASDFTLRSANDELVTLSELRPRRVVLVFYRGHW